MFDVIALAASLGAAAWAALLTLAEESPSVERALVEGTDRPARTPGYRVIHVARIALLLIAAVGAGRAAPWWQASGWVAFGIAGVTLGFLFMVTEALPRAVSVLAPGLSASVAPAVERSTWVFRPLMGLVRAAERTAKWVLPTPKSTPAAVRSAQRDLLMGVFSLGDTTVAEIMTPRLDIVAVEDDAEWGEVVEVVRRSEHARLPVYHDTLDNVTGILDSKDLVPSVRAAAAEPLRWQNVVRPVEFIPESKTLAMQLRDFQRGPSHIAVVVDEFGGTAGLVTREDVLEEVVGEIHDEYDVVEQPPIVREGVDEFWVDGNVTLDELHAVLETSMAGEDVSTVGGLVYSQLGRVPNPGDEFRIGEFRVVVEQVVRRRVRRVYFQRQLEPQPTVPGPEPPGPESPPS